MYLAQTSRRFEDAIIDDPSMPTRGVEYDSQRDDLTSEIAIFGDAVFALAPNVELSLAGRYDVSRQAVRATAEGLQADFFHDQVAEKSFSPKVELSFAPRAGDFYYVSGGRGYRHGGFNTGAARIFTGAMQPGRRYGDDEVWSAEVGTKKSFFDEKAHVRAAAFWQDWRNIQTDQLFAAGVPFTGNVGNAQSRGVEIETSLQASEPLQIRLNLAYTDTAITKVDPSFPARLRAGLPGAPHVSAGLAVDYKKSLANELNFGAFLRAWYVGESSLAFTRTRELSIGDYADVDGRVKLECADWTAALFVNNALNARSATYSYGNPIRFGGAGMITPLRPRMFGMELSKNF
jgi:outer membrane receptor protein involved in Fe transport